MASDFMNYWEKRKAELLEHHDIDENTIKFMFVEAVRAWTARGELMGDSKIDMEVLLRELTAQPKVGLLGRMLS